MSEKKCPTCGSNMGVGASTAENIKAVFECWCGEIVTEFYPEEELPKLVVEPAQANAASVTV